MASFSGDVQPYQRPAHFPQEEPPAKRVGVSAIDLDEFKIRKGRFYQAVKLVTSLYKSAEGLSFKEGNRSLSLNYITEALGPHFHPQIPEHFYPFKNQEGIPGPFEQWNNSESTLSYKQWLQENPGVLEGISPVQYLNKAERKEYEVRFVDGKLQKSYERAGIPYSTTLEETRYLGDGAAMFVVSPDKKMYSGTQVIGTFHHSSFLAGSPILSGGEWRVDVEGTILEISNKSGHYIPSRNENLALLSMLKENGVDLTKVAFREVAICESVDVIYHAEEYLTSEGMAIPRAFSDTEFTYLDMAFVPFPDIKAHQGIFDLLEKDAELLQSTLSGYMTFIDQFNPKKDVDCQYALIDDEKIDGVGLEGDRLYQYGHISAFLETRLGSLDTFVVIKATPFGRVFQPVNFVFLQEYPSFLLSEHFFFIRNGENAVVLIDKGGVSPEVMSKYCNEFLYAIKSLDDNYRKNEDEDGDGEEAVNLGEFLDDVEGLDGNYSEEEDSDPLDLSTVVFKDGEEVLDLDGFRAKYIFGLESSEEDSSEESS